MRPTRGPIASLLVLAGLLASPLAAQQGGSVTGFVRSAENDRPVEAAVVTVVGGTQGATTDASGRFRLASVAAGEVRLAIRAIGLAPDTVAVTVVAGAEARVTVALRRPAVALAEVYVTAQNRTQAESEVPIAVSALEGTFLTENNVRTLDNFAAFVPGLTVQIQSPNNPGFVIRGITSDDGDSRIEPRVSVFQDGVSISKSRGSVVELYDMERVEVLKGPQGTLFGRGAQIGAVHLIQNKAANEYSSSVRFGYGRFNEFLGQGHVNAPLVQDRLFVRLAGIVNRRDGFLENAAGGTLNGKETYAGRLSLRWLAGRNTVVDLIGNLQYDGPPGTSFKSGTFAPPGGSTDPTTFAGLEEGRDLGLRRWVGGGTLLVNHTLSPTLRLKSISAARRFDSDERFDADGTLAPALQFNEIAKGDQLSQEFRLTWEPSRAFAGFVGASAFYEKGSQAVPFNTDERSFWPLLTGVINNAVPAFPRIPFVGPTGQPVLVPTLGPEVGFLGAPQLVGAPLRPFHSEQTTNFGRTFAAELFADGTVRVTDVLSVTAGLRGTYEDIRNGLENRFDGTPSPLGLLAGLGAFPNILFAPTNGRPEAAGTFTSWVGRLSATAAATRDVNVFGSVSRGRRPPVILVRPNGSADTLRNEIVWSYEGGVKTLLADGRVQFDANAFYYTYANFQTPVLQLGTGGAPIFGAEDAGSATAWGVETQVRAQATRELGFFANYGYLNASFDEFDAQGRPQQRAGNRFRLAPEHKFALGSTLRLPWGRAGSVFVQPNYTWQSQVFFEETNLPGVEQAAFGLLNGRVGATLPDGRTELSVYASNLLDTRYIIDAGNTGGLFGIPTFIAGPPRAFGLQVARTF